MILFQKGLTMTEMLGVLAIIGVLSVGALAGFTYAMNKHRANETIHDVMLRATNVPMIDEEYTTRSAPYEWKFGGLLEDGKKGSFYVMTTVPSDLTEYIYKVEVVDIPERVCKMILQMNPTDIDAIYVDDLPEANECGKTLNKMAFYFDDQWGPIGPNSPVSPTTPLPPPDANCKATTTYQYGDNCEKTALCCTNPLENSCPPACTPACTPVSCTECENEVLDDNGCAVDCELKTCEIICTETQTRAGTDSCGCATQCVDNCQNTTDCPTGQVCVDEICQECKTCEQLGCGGGSCINLCVRDDNGCAVDCAGANCPEGTVKVESGEEGCLCLGTNCSDGAQSSSVCCVIKYMTGTCGEGDNPFEHVWVGDVFGAGYCCCSEQESQACCEADLQVWCDGICCPYGQNCAGSTCCNPDKMCGTAPNQTCCTTAQTCSNGTCCPTGSSTTGTGQTTSVATCKCPSTKPAWNGTTCAACPAATPKWNGTMCVQCLTNSDCASNQYCASNVCLVKECNSDSDCPSSAKPFCDDNNFKCRAGYTITGSLPGNLCESNWSRTVTCKYNKAAFDGTDGTCCAKDEVVKTENVTPWKIQSCCQPGQVNTHLPCTSGGCCDPDKVKTRDYYCCGYSGTGTYCDN